MSILIFALVVGVLLALSVYAVRAARSPPPLNWIVPVVAEAIAIVPIGQRAGLL